MTRRRLLLGLLIILLALVVSGCEGPTAPACPSVDTIGLAARLEFSVECPTVVVVHVDY